MGERIDMIHRAVEKAAGCSAVHMESVPVIETLSGEVIWKGMVEVFLLANHLRANKAYGWRLAGVDQSECAVVLEIPPVISPITAVRSAIAAGAQSRTN